MGMFDGEPGGTSYGQALAVLVSKTPGLSEIERRELTKVFLSAHGEYIVPQEELIADEIEKLRALKAAQDKDAAAAAQLSELHALRVSLGLDPETGQPVNAAPSDITVGGVPLSTISAQVDPTAGTSTPTA